MLSTKSLPHFPTLPLFFGVVFLLVGVFAAARIIINMKTLSQYPVQGIMPVSLSLNSYVPYPQRPEDCTTQSLYYSPDGSTRAPTEAEQQSDQKNQQNCLNSLKFNSDVTKRNDMATAALFLILGVGLLATMPFYHKADDCCGEGGCSCNGGECDCGDHCNC